MCGFVSWFYTTHQNIIGVGISFKNHKDDTCKCRIVNFVNEPEREIRKNASTIRTWQIILPKRRPISSCSIFFFSFFAWLRTRWQKKLDVINPLWPSSLSGEFVHIRQSVQLSPSVDHRTLIMSCQVQNLSRHEWRTTVHALGQNCLLAVLTFGMVTQTHPKQNSVKTRINPVSTLFRHLCHVLQLLPAVDCEFWFKTRPRLCWNCPGQFGFLLVKTSTHDLPLKILCLAQKLAILPVRTDRISFKCLSADIIQVFCPDEPSSPKIGFSIASLPVLRSGLIARSWNQSEVGATL